MAVVKDDRRTLAALVSSASMVAVWVLSKSLKASSNFYRKRVKQLEKINLSKQTMKSPSDIYLSHREGKKNIEENLKKVKSRSCDQKIG